MARLQMFLSHVHVESRFADVIQACVERDVIGLVKVYVALDRGILAGRKWVDALTKTLNASDLHAVLCSPESLTRHWVSFETGAAHLRGIPKWNRRRKLRSGCQTVLVKQSAEAIAAVDVSDGGRSWREGWSTSDGRDEA